MRGSSAFKPSRSISTYSTVFSRGLRFELQRDWILFRFKVGPLSVKKMRA